MRTSTTPRPLRRLAVASVAALALGAGSGCGAHDSTGAAPAPSRPATSAPASSGAPAAAASAGAASSAPVAKAPTRNQLDPAAFVALVRSGVRDLSTLKMSMTTAMRGQVVTAKGAMDLGGAQPAMRMAMDLTGMGTPTEMRLVDGVMYVQTTPGGMFATYDVGDDHSPLGDLSGTMGDLDPRSMITALSPDVFRSVTDLGPTTIGGQRLEHYRVVVDTRASQASQSGAGATVKLPRRLTYDLWLDGHHRMARFVMAMKKYLRVTARYYDYGVPVHVAAPPAARVIGAG